LHAYFKLKENKTAVLLLYLSEGGERRAGREEIREEREERTEEKRREKRRRDQRGESCYS